MKNNSPPHKEILSLLKEIKMLIWAGNFEDRLGEIHNRLNNGAGSDEEIRKRIQAIERYFGITFNEQNRYERKTNTKRKR